MRKIFTELEKEYSLKYVTAERRGRGVYKEKIYKTAAEFLNQNIEKANLYIIDQAHRMLLYLNIDFFRGKNEAIQLQNAFGDKLYNDFVGKAEREKS